ncbi:hypothetical protein D3C76_1493690 [compost metagenome]
MIVQQRGQTLDDTAWRIHGQQAGDQGIGAAADRRGFQQQRLALQAHLAHRQAKAFVDQGLRQVGFGEQPGQRLTGRFATDEADQRRIGQQHMATGVHRQYRIAHRREQGFQLQVPALAGEKVDQLHRLDPDHSQQGVVKFVQHGL